MKPMNLNSDESAVVAGHFVIQNDRGLHTRPSTELVKCASKFQADVTLCCEGNVANAKSLLGVLMLAATKGTRIEVKATGVDANLAIQKLTELASQQFKSEY